ARGVGDFGHEALRLRLAAVVAREDVAGDREEPGPRGDDLLQALRVSHHLQEGIVQEIARHAGRATPDEVRQDLIRVIAVKDCSVWRGGGHRPGLALPMKSRGWRKSSFAPADSFRRGEGSRS